MSLMLIWKRFKWFRCEKNPLPSVNCIIGEQKIYFVWGLLSVAKIFSFEIPFSQRIEKRVIEVQLRRMSRNQLARETPFFFLRANRHGPLFLVIIYCFPLSESFKISNLLLSRISSKNFLRSKTCSIS